MLRKILDHFSSILIVRWKYIFKRSFIEENASKNYSLIRFHHTVRIVAKPFVRKTTRNNVFTLVGKWMPSIEKNMSSSSRRKMRLIEHKITEKRYLHGKELNLRSLFLKIASFDFRTLHTKKKIDKNDAF